jgi:hypothetical protein
MVCAGTPIVTSDGFSKLIGPGTFITLHQADQAVDQLIDVAE